MSGTKDGEIEALLERAAAGDSAAARELFPLVYQELRRLAASRLSTMPPGVTLQPTALVHEAYMRLARSNEPGWKGRAHFFGAAANAMRNILVEHARARGRLKRGGDRRRVDLDDACAGFDQECDRLLGVDRVIDRLAVFDQQKAEIVKLTFFVGLTHEQIAEIMGVTVRTIERQWRFARAWLAKELDADDGIGLDVDDDGSERD